MPSRRFLAPPPVRRYTNAIAGETPRSADSLRAVRVRSVPGRRGGCAVDDQRRDAFGARALQIINDAGIAMMMSIGHRTGLFDAMASMPPSTAEEIASAAGCDERYVREWLGAVTVGRLVDFDAQTLTFVLPPEHAAFLTRGARGDNMAFQAQYLGMFGTIEDRIVEAFRHGGGVGYEHFPHFQGLMAAESALVFDGALVDSILPLVPGMVSRLHAGIDVADVGCGQGHAVNVMAAAFPLSRFTGLDLSEDGIAAAWEEAEELGLSNATFAVRDVADFEGAYDLVTGFDVVHDQARPRELLRAIRRSLRPEGVFLCADIDTSSKLEENLDLDLAPWIYTFSLMHCMTVSLALGGEGLGAAWGVERARQYFEEAGFKVDAVEHIPADAMNAYFVCRPT